MKAIFSSGVIPVIPGKEPIFLLLRCFKYWDFPKGQVEAGEDPRLAAIRELEEETGINKGVMVSEDFKETETYSKNKIARYYLGELKTQAEVSLIPNPITGILEHHEYRWVSYDEAKSLVVPRVKKILDWAYSKSKMSVIPK